MALLGKSATFTHWEMVMSSDSQLGTCSTQLSFRIYLRPLIEVRGMPRRQSCCALSSHTGPRETYASHTTPPLWQVDNLFA